MSTIIPKIYFGAVSSRIHPKVWSELEYNIRLNLPGSFRITIPKLAINSEPTLGNISEARVEILPDGSTVPLFEGYTENIEKGEDSWTFEGRTLDVALSNELVAAREKIYTNQATATIIKDLLDTYSTNVGYHDADIEASGITHTVRYNYDNLWEAVQKVTYLAGQDFWCTGAGSDILLHVANVRGRGDEYSPAFQLSTSHNVEITEYIENTRDIVNKVTVFGKGDGINQITRTVPGDIAHAGATQSQTDYGIKHYQIEDGSIDTTGEADALATKILDDNYALLTQFTVKMKRLPEFGLGDYVEIFSKTRNIRVVRRVKEIKVRWLFANLPETTVYFTERNDVIEGAISELHRKTLTARTHQQGATNMWQIGDAVNATASKPMTLDFYLPADVVTVNDLRFDLKVGALRHFSHSNNQYSALISASDVTINQTWQNVGSAYTVPTGVSIGILVCAWWDHIGGPGGGEDQVFTRIYNSTKAVYYPGSGGDQSIQFLNKNATGINYQSATTVILLPDGIDGDSLQIQATGGHAGGVLHTASGIYHWVGLVDDIYEGSAPGGGNIGAYNINGGANRNYTSAGISSDDIKTGEIVNTGAWNTITITPSGAEKHFLKAEVYIKCYIEST